MNLAAQMGILPVKGIIDLMHGEQYMPCFATRDC